MRFVILNVHIQGSKCKCVAKKLRCDNGKCMCCERSGCHAHHEDFGADVAADVERQMLQRGMPKMMGEMFGNLDMGVDAEDEAEDMIMAHMPKFVKGQRSIKMESPKKMRQRMDKEFESFFKEFENIDNVRRDKRKRKK